MYIWQVCGITPIKRLTYILLRIEYSLPLKQRFCFGEVGVKNPYGIGTK